jgi:hypothetical protein
LEPNSLSVWALALGLIADITPKKHSSLFFIRCRLLLTAAPIHSYADHNRKNHAERRNSGNDSDRRWADYRRPSAHPASVSSDRGADATAFV